MRFFLLRRFSKGARDLRRRGSARLRDPLKRSAVPRPRWPRTEQAETRLDSLRPGCKCPWTAVSPLGRCPRASPSLCLGAGHRRASLGPGPRAWAEPRPAKPAEQRHSRAHQRGGEGSPRPPARSLAALENPAEPPSHLVSRAELQLLLWPSGFPERPLQGWGRDPEGTVRVGARSRTRLLHPPLGLLQKPETWRLGTRCPGGTEGPVTPIHTPHRQDWSLQPSF